MIIDKQTVLRIISLVNKKWNENITIKGAWTYESIFIRCADERVTVVIGMQ